MISKYDWLELEVQKGKIILVESNFELSVEKVFCVWRNVIDYKDVRMIISVLPKPMAWVAGRYKQISRTEETEIISLYFTYEFSNNFRVLSKQSCSGSFLNLVDAGLLSLEEALVAWLHG